MGQLVVKNIDDDIVSALEQRAIRNGRSTEDETRAILRDALQREVSASEPEQPHEAIDVLYGELAQLVAKRRPGLDDNDLEQQIADALKRLRTLQQAAAQSMQERFERRMSMPLDAGQRTLDEIKDFLARVRDEARSS